MQAIFEAKGIKYALETVGSHHTYQIRSLAIMALHHIFKVFFVMYYPFMNQPPIFLCRDTKDPNLFYECTENNGGCFEQIFSLNSPDSLVVELGLYCEKAYVRTFASILFFLGGNIGSVYFASMSDKKGRKTAMFYSYLLGSIAILFLGTGVNNAATYIGALILIRAGMSLHCSLTLTYLTEISSEEFSRVGTLIVLLSNTVAELGLVILAYFVTSWKVMVVFYIALPCLLFTILFVFLEETPVFYHSRKEIAKAALVLNKIAQINKKPILDNVSSPPDTPQTTVTSSPLPAIRIRSSVKTWNYVSILLHVELRKMVITYSLIMFYVCMAFYGCLFALSSLGGSIYVNATIIALAETLGYCLAYRARYLSASLLMKRSLLVIVISGLSFLLIPIISCGDGFIMCNPLFLQGILSFIMRTALCFVYGFIYNVGNEVFPAIVRSQSLGISEVFAVFGAAFAPLVILFADTYQMNALFLFGALGVIGLFSAYYLSDTRITGLEEEDNAGIEMNYVKGTRGLNKLMSKSCIEHYFLLDYILCLLYKDNKYCFFYKTFYDFII